MAADLLIKNINLATMDALPGDLQPYGAKHDSAITVKDGIIDWMGDSADAGRIVADATIDGKGEWLTPGLVDCHTHLVYGGNRASEFELKLKGASYEEIARSGGGIVSTVDATRRASKGELFDLASQRLSKLRREGVTTVEIKSGYGLNLDDEVKMLAVARQLESQFPVTVKTSFLGAHALPKEFTDKDAYIRFVIDEVLPVVVDQQLADAVDFFCEGIGFSLDQCRRIAEAAIDSGLDIKGHVEQLSYLRGARMVAELGGLSVDHLEYLIEEDVSLIQAAGTVAVLLPGAFYSLGETQLPPIKSLLEAKIPIAVATDLNPGSSPIASLLNVMNLACVQFKLPPEIVVAGVTRNAARALGLQDQLGQIRVGFRADLVQWPIETPAQLCYGMNLVSPTRIFKDGKSVGP